MSSTKGNKYYIIAAFVALLTTILAVNLAFPEKTVAVAHAEEMAFESKSMGDPSAQIVLREYSSLTCGHCAAFHKGTLQELKTRYIDTGKLYYVYTEFPLNKPALDAALIARCMPDTRFWSFTDLLFSQQHEWAFNSKDYLLSLKQNAKLAGMSESQVDSCLKEEKTKDAMIRNMQEAAEKYQIDATPTFILEAGGKQEKLIGNQSVQSFMKTIEKHLGQENGSKP